MDPCRNGFPPQGASGASYGCLGTFVVHLNPGIGGTLAWSAAWTQYMACDEPINAGAVRTTTGTIEVPSGATQAKGKLAIFAENYHNPLVVKGRPAANVSSIAVAITGGASGKSAPTPFFSDGVCAEDGSYTSPTWGTSVPYP